MPFLATGRVSISLLLCSLFLVNCGVTSPTASSSTAPLSSTPTGLAYPSLPVSSYPAPPTQVVYLAPPTAVALPGPVAVDYPGKILGIVYDQKLQVVAVDPGSPAEQATVRGGDRIIAVNGKPVTTPAEFQQNVRPLLQISDMSILVKRTDKEVLISITPGMPAARVSTPTPVPADLYYE